MSRWDSRTDAELLAAGPANPDAFAAFYRRHVPTVLALVGRRARRQADVGDLVAEVFATALVYRRRYDPKRGTAVAWLTGARPVNKQITPKKYPNFAANLFMS